MESKGDIIRERRLFMKISQQKLAEGICSQSMISRLENDQFNIKFKDLEEILDRLNIGFHDLYRVDNSESREVRKSLDAARNDQDYDKIEAIIHTEKDREFWRSSIELEAYFQWHYGLVRYVKYKNSKNAIQALDEAVRWSERNQLMSFSLPEMYITKGTIYNSLGMLNLEWYKKAEESYYKLGNTDFRLEMKILCNIITVYCRKGDYDKVLNYCMKALAKLKEYESTYFMCEVYYSKMIAHIERGETENYMKFREWGRHLFEEKNRLELWVNLENYAVQNNLL